MWHFMYIAKSIYMQEHDFPIIPLLSKDFVLSCANAVSSERKEYIHIDDLKWTTYIFMLSCKKNHRSYRMLLA